MHPNSYVYKFRGLKDKDELRKIWKKIEHAKKTRAEMYSLWTTELYRLSIANMVLLYFKLYFE